jgi:hypothetical protein
LHGTEDSRGVKAAGEIDDRGDEFPGVVPRLGIGRSEREAVQQPARAGAERGDFHVMVIEHALEIRDIDGIGRGRKNFHGIKAQFGSADAAVGQSRVEDERAGAGL